MLTDFWTAVDGITISGHRVDATVSIGVNTGPVHLRSLDEADYTTLGDTTNVAARLEGAAGIGETLISRATYHQIRGIFAVKDAGPMQLKGRKEPGHAYRVLREFPSAARRHRHGFEGRESRVAAHRARRRVQPHPEPTAGGSRRQRPVAHRPDR
jgi:hypothetical protein